MQFGKSSITFNLIELEFWQKILKALFNNDWRSGKPSNKAWKLLHEIIFIYVIVFEFFFLFRLGLLIYLVLYHLWILMLDD